MLSYQTVLGRLLRLPLSLIPSQAQVRILRGPLRGQKWIVGSSTHACWAGTYEVERLRTFGEAISPGATVFDVGANVGIYSLLASLRAGPSGHIYAFEPNPRNLRHLRRHAALNAAQNCTVVDAAVSATVGSRHFSAAAWDSAMGHLSPDGDATVRSVTLDACVYGPSAFHAPDVVKIDVEGAEWEVLQGANRVIAASHPAIFLEVHGTELHAKCREFFLAHRYNIEEAYGYIKAM